MIKTLSIRKGLMMTTMSKEKIMMKTLNTEIETIVSIISMHPEGPKKPLKE